MTGTALNIWDVNFTYKQELLGLNHIKSTWRRLKSSSQKPLYLWCFPYTVNILHSHLQLVLDIHWKNLSFKVTELQRAYLHVYTHVDVQKLDRSPQIQHLHKTVQYFTLSLMCYSTVAGGSCLSHHHALRYLFRQFYKSAALLVWIKYSVGIQVINFHLTPVMLLVPCCSADN